MSDNENIDFLKIIPFILLSVLFNKPLLNGTQLEEITQKVIEKIDKSIENGIMIDLMKQIEMEINEYFKLKSENLNDEQ